MCRVMLVGEIHMEKMHIVLLNLKVSQGLLNVIKLYCITWRAVTALLRLVTQTRQHLPGDLKAIKNN